MEAGDRRYAFVMVVALIACGAGVLALEKSGDEINWWSPFGVSGGALMLIGLGLLVVVVAKWAWPSLKEWWPWERKKSRRGRRPPLPAETEWVPVIAHDAGHISLKKTAATLAGWNAKLYTTMGPEGETIILMIGSDQGTRKEELECAVMQPNDLEVRTRDVTYPPVSPTDKGLVQYPWGFLDAPQSWPPMEGEYTVRWLAVRYETSGSVKREVADMMRFKADADGNIQEVKETILEDNRTWHAPSDQCATGWSANMGIVTPKNQPRQLGLQLQTTGDDVPIREAYCVIQKEHEEPSVVHPGHQYGDPRSNNFVTYFPEDFPGVEKTWPLKPGRYSVTWVNAAGGTTLCGYEFHVSDTGQVIARG